MSPNKQNTTQLYVLYVAIKNIFLSVMRISKLSHKIEDVVCETRG